MDSDRNFLYTLVLVYLKWFDSCERSFTPFTETSNWKWSLICSGFLLKMHGLNFRWLPCLNWFSPFTFLRCQIIFIWSQQILISDKQKRSKCDPSIFALKSKQWLTFHIYRSLLFLLSFWRSWTFLSASSTYLVSFLPLYTASRIKAFKN